MRTSPGWMLAAAIAMLAALSATHAAAPALASPIPGASEAEPEPGIGITGVGFARSRSTSAEASNPLAVDRAVRNARARAAAIARALGVRVGEVEGVVLREAAQFGERRPSGIAAAAATVRFAIDGGAAEVGEAREVEAYGAGFAPVRPDNSNRSRSIKRAVLAARREVTPEAATAARRNAGAAARSVGLRLGEVVSISEAPTPYYGPPSSFYDSALGSFGPGRFCGIYRRPVIRADPKTGLPRVVRRVRRRSCTFQTHYSLHLEIAYLAQPR